MELYALLLLHGSADQPMTTRRLSQVRAASPSQSKQIALRLCARGLAERRGRTGRTQLTETGCDLACEAEARLQEEVAGRVARIEAGALSTGSSTLGHLLNATA